MAFFFQEQGRQAKLAHESQAVTDKTWPVSGTGHHATGSHIESLVSKMAVDYRDFGWDAIGIGAAVDGRNRRIVGGEQ